MCIKNQQNARILNNNCPKNIFPNFRKTRAPLPPVSYAYAAGNIASYTRLLIRTRFIYARKVTVECEKFLKIVTVKEFRKSASI